MSEIPTARLRGLNVALAAATQWLFNLVIARAVPNMLVTMGEGGYGAFITFACFCLAMFIFVWFLVPETKAIPLESMDRLFAAKPVWKANQIVLEQDRAREEEFRHDAEVVGVDVAKEKHVHAETARSGSEA